MNLKETLLYFSVPSGKQTKGHKGPAALFPVFVASRADKLVSRNNQVAVQPNFQLRALVQLHVTAFEEEAGSGSKARACGCSNSSAFVSAQNRSGNGAHGCANGRIGNDLLFVRSLAVNLAFFTAGLD